VESGKVVKTEGKGKKNSGGSAGKDQGGNRLGPEHSKISCADIQYVQNLIERCLQQYMTRKDVVFALQYQARIEPGFTTLVWQKLEEQNPAFFMAYHVRVKLKDQVVLFNHLLEQQMQMIKKLQTSHMGPQSWQQKAGGMGQGPIQHPHLSSSFPMHHPMHHPMGMPHHPHSGGMMHPAGLHHPGMNPTAHMNPHSNPMAHHNISNPSNPLYGDVQHQMGQASGMYNAAGGNQGGSKNGLEQQLRDHAARDPNPFTDYNQGRGLESPPFPAGLARPSSIGLDLSQAEGQSNMNISGMPKVFSLSDLTMELGAQLGTDGDVSLSLLAGNESSGLGIFPRNLSLGDIAKLETM